MNRSNFYVIINKLKEHFDDAWIETAEDSFRVFIVLAVPGDEIIYAYEYDTDAVQEPMSVVNNIWERIIDENLPGRSTL